MLEPFSSCFCLAFLLFESLSSSVILLSWFLLGLGVFLVDVCGVCLWLGAGIGGGCEVRGGEGEKTKGSEKKKTNGSRESSGHLPFGLWFWFFLR